MKVLNIIETAYRATLEEQDDTIVWVTHAMKGAGGEFSVLLRGNAVNYGVRGQDASGLAFGAEQQTQPPNLAGDVDLLTEKGIEVFYVKEDADERGLEPDALIGSLQPIARAQIASLFDRHDQVWHW